MVQTRSQSQSLSGPGSPIQEKITPPPRAPPMTPASQKIAHRNTKSTRTRRLVDFRTNTPYISGNKLRFNALDIHSTKKRRRGESSSETSPTSPTSPSERARRMRDAKFQRRVLKPIISPSENVKIAKKTKVKTNRIGCKPEDATKAGGTSGEAFDIVIDTKLNKSEIQQRYLPSEAEAETDRNTQKNKENGGTSSESALTKLQKLMDDFTDDMDAANKGLLELVEKFGTEDLAFAMANMNGPAAFKTKLFQTILLASSTQEKDPEKETNKAASESN
ncbi:hypothetical protein H072_524 [Dactylellina haptotyla CBS 200.50]|uniref:Uncharacterized protein n=1 Tax=Dactylellina haptotyla (strain CBS 200.50) TaxID=1284197 RepID=S8CCW3_DACHA|nr:hypothetical protein H072_524 [Dactylellina haptotyla CBS 200.50]